MNEAETRAVTGISYHVIVNHVDTLFNFKLNFANFYYPLHSGIA